ncbi:plastocyanin [Halothece sp. PCC 7418]|uniref:plastocyanin n=1 Tax=Halothece sp. (strain PCC 7418) TaxID=65093 RepID=UPI0002A06281|nr:plastocyanin [Halothece sp. PCC 7418]AFZ44082.1 plastocyanin [Halothece sp. PCC 7418]
MKPIQTVLTLFLAVTLLLGGCAGSSEAKSPDAQTAPTEETAPSEQTTEPVEEETPATEETAQMEETAEPEEMAAAETESTEIAADVEEDASATGGKTYQVKMGSDTGQLQYVPSKLTIHPGDTVEFVMNKLAPHNVVFDSNGVPSGAKALASSLSKNKLLSGAGESHTVTFPEDAPKGEYKYYCQPHRGAGMNGTIIVE